MDKEDRTEAAFNILNYDMVYILLKSECVERNHYKKYLKHDKKKNRYYIIGKVIGGDEFKNFQSLSVIQEGSLSIFKKASTVKAQKEMILNIFFVDIDFINLQFDSLDWKK